MKIKIILQHFHSKTDINGNSLWFHKATNTNTGHSLYWESPHSSNAASAVSNAGYGWREIHECGQVEMSIRDFNGRIKALKEHSCLLYDSCKDPKIIKAIKNLRFKNTK